VCMCEWWAATNDVLGPSEKDFEFVRDMGTDESLV
jgi:hypothetical protein